MTMHHQLGSEADGDATAESIVQAIEEKEAEVPKNDEEQDTENAFDLQRTKEQLDWSNLYAVDTSGNHVLNENGDRIPKWECNIQTLGLPILKPDIVFFGEDLPRTFYGRSSFYRYVNAHRCHQT